MTIDTEKIEVEKQKLKDLVSPAIKNFIQETGLTPHITFIVTTHETRCATITSPPEIHISASI